MTNEEIYSSAYPIIERLANIRSVNGSFAYYESSDVYQEVWSMCLEALDRYNPEIGPIENFLVRHVANRMKNLKRDRYFRPGFDISSSGLAKTKMNLVNALPFGSCETVDSGTLLGSQAINVDPTHNLLCQETIKYITDRLPEELLPSFQDLLGNNRVRSPLVSEIQHTVAEILSERDKDGKK